MIKTKTAFVTFFPIMPNNMGSSTVVNSRFSHWPKKKRLFQISHIKKINNKNITTIFIKKETPINKIFKLPELIFKIYKYVQHSKNKLVVIEGASWIFYSFTTIFILKLILSDCKTIYISHSVESEIRKKYSSKFIYHLTKFLENLVFKFSNYSTTVSIKERRKIFNLYKKKTKTLPNAVDIEEKKIQKKRKKFYIIYSGSYLYKPNKDAIDFLNQQIMPSIVKKFPKIKLVLTGGGYDKDYPWLINKGIVSKKRLYDLIYNAGCMCVPLKFGSGTRIKILEALTLGTIVISSTKGIEGIKLNKKNPPYIVNDKNKIIKTLIMVFKNFNRLKKKSYKNKIFYKNTYSMKNITYNFIKSTLNKYFNESKNS
tara:strand:- start:7371 stop:8480 length:1110 start_codon:yes stop_codon:yes gene_type:complete